MTASYSLFTCLLIAGAIKATALQCYVTSHNGTVSTLQENDDWRYCVFYQPLPVIRVGSVFEMGNDASAQFGLKEGEDVLSVFDGVFGDDDDDMHAVLSTCLLEKMSEPDNLKQSEFMFRCLCRADGCNRGLSVDTFLKHMQYMYTDYGTQSILF